MNRRDAKRRARAAAADVIIGTIESGWALDDLTDDRSDEQVAMINAALRELVAEMRRRLPKGYTLPPRPPGALPQWGVER
ncbi:hypothetical protein [Streptosporangium oxazolinicum]|uniref:hypothetical protein n=1 Tax=Streptosporangium oxazolinicum TaxID=909287 RepID=UPI0031E91E88